MGRAGSRGSDDPLDDGTAPSWNRTALLMAPMALSDGWPCSVPPVPLPMAPGAVTTGLLNRYLELKRRELF
ncbi:MAG: hypothetical protein ACO3FE_21680 [Planctomycetaceae bacterium]